MRFPTGPANAIRSPPSSTASGCASPCSASRREQRAAVVLRHYEDMSEAQTASALGCTVGTVKSQTAKGLDRLRLLLNDD